MNFYTPDTHDFLRLNKPELFGNNLQSFHKITVKANESKEIQSGVEVGEYGIYYRVVFPVFKDNKHIGAFEFGIDIKYLMSRLSILNLHAPLLLVSKEAAEPIYKYDESADSYIGELTNNYSFIKYNQPTKEKKSILDIADKRIINENSYIIKNNDEEYLIFRGYTLRDYKNSDIGYFVFMDEMDYYMVTIVFIRWISIIATILLVIIIVALIYKLINRYTAELTEQKDILDYQAHYDLLTGLSNRILFNDRLEQAVEKGKRQESKFALFFIDLDRFKQINDSLGHSIGDKVLQIIAKRLQVVMRKEDSISRLGGDEFTILVQDLKDGTDASLLAQKIIYSLSEPINIENHTLYVTTSIGISIFPNDGISANNLLKYADAAMYKAKEEGKNNFQYYSSEMTEKAFERVVMEASLRKALSNNEFVVYYQPQIDGRTDKIIGMEALVRWLHPNEGLVFPDKFIPLAQETGLILAIDQWVMLSAMKQITAWYKMGLNPGVLALNLSMRQLGQEGCVDKLSAMLKESGCKPEWLELEVTEGEIMKNPENAIDVLKNISSMGIELAVDDFGTGYSSLSYLKRLPIDKLKIDKSFVNGLPDDEEDVSIARAIIALAHSLKLSVIAEGVETKEQKEFLVENGCDFIQGYYYSKPIPSDEMEKFLNK
jgi:diguanylate cyclase (GGDEF)-like protein